MAKPNDPTHSPAVDHRALERSAAHAPVALYQFERLDDRAHIPFVTEPVERVLGVDAATMMREFDLDWLAARTHPDDWDDFSDALDESRRTGDTFDQTFRFRADDHQPWRWIRATSAAEDNASGRVWHGSLQDVTSVIEKRQALDLTRRRLSTLVENVSVGLLVEDDRGRIEQLNRTLIELFDVDYDTDDLAGLAIERCREILAPRFVDPDTAIAWFAQRRRERKPARHTFSMGDGRVLECIYRPLTDTSGEGAHLWQWHDVTDDKRAEDQLRQAKREAEAAVAAKSDFVARMSHELRTPLSGILGITELMTRSPLTEEQHEYCDIIAASGHTLLSIINEVLDFTRGQEGKLDHQSGPFDLYEVLFGAAKMLMANAANAGLDLAVHYPPDAPRTFVGDARKLRQVALNLIGNAIKFTDEGHVCVRVDISEPVGASSKVRVEVCDTGVGIPPLDQDRLFEAFTQLPGQHRPGTGLGLAICRHFVESMGGTIGVDSTVGAGSTFWLELDLPRFEEATGDVLHTSLNDQRLLVVHECLAVRKLAEDYLRYAGASVHSFASVEEVLAKLDVLCAVPFDALLVDEHRSAQSLREELARRQADPPALIFLDHRRQRAAGDHDTPSLEQPLHIHHLLDTVGTALSRRQGHDETVHDRNLRYCRTRPVTDPRIKRVNRPRRVLLVEDDPINCTVVTRMLETLRCTVTHAPDGPDAVAAARASEFDLILMDCQLPTFTGIEATRQIRGLDTERTTHQPILALSANVMPEFRQACIEAGMDDFLLKPVNRDQLSRALLEWCGGETLDEASSAASDRIEPPVVFDRDALLARFDYEEDLVDAVVDAFCQDLPRRLDLMREAVKLRRSEDLDRHAHTLAGAAGQVGADTIAQAAERIRQAIRAHDWDRVRYNIGWLFEESQLFERLISGELTSVIDESEDETPS